jgi:hypothetical protein
MDINKAIQAFVKEKYGFSVKTCWIAHVKELSGLEVKPAPNRKGPERLNPCPPNKRKAIEEALKHFGFIK